MKKGTGDRTVEYTAVLSRIRELARKDLYFLSKEILNYDMLDGEFHGKLCDFLRSDYKEDKMVLQFRGSFKSTLITVCENIQDILNDPDITILIQQSTDENATAHLTEIRSHFESNEMFRAVFPEFCPPAGEKIGTTYRMTIPNRTKKFLPQATVEAAGVTTRLTSRHYTKIVCDDIIDESTVNTSDQIDKAKERYRLTRSLLMPNGWRRVVGTRYDYDDVHGWILKYHKDKYNVYQQAAEEQGEPVFPKLYSKGILDKIKSEQGNYIYGCQYLLEPVQRDNQQFIRSWFNYYDASEYDKELNAEGFTFIAIDWASGQSRSANDTGIAVITTVPNKDIYVREALTLNKTPYETIDMLLNLCVQYKPLGVAMETNASQHFAREFTRYKMVQADTYFSIYPINQHRNKSLRIIMGLQPLYQNNAKSFGRKIYHNRRLYEGKLEEQLVRFGGTNEDDLPDALEMAVSIAYMPAQNDKNEPPWGSLAALRKRAKRANDIKNSLGKRYKSLEYSLPWQN